MKLIGEKPPLGLRPKSEADRARAQEIAEAMARYFANGKKVPREWFNELNHIVSVFEASDEECAKFCEHGTDPFGRWLLGGEV